MKITIDSDMNCSGCHLELPKDSTAIITNSKLFCESCDRINSQKQVTHGIPIETRADLLAIKKKKSKVRLPSKKSQPEWSSNDDVLLETKWKEWVSIEDIAKEVKQTENSVRSRIRKLRIDVKLGRNLPPSIYQLNTIEKLGGSDSSPRDTAEASVLIDQLIRKNGANVSPLKSQIRALKFLGIEKEIPKNILEAERLIENQVLFQLKKLGCEKIPAKSFDALNLLRRMKRKKIKKKWNNGICV